MAIKRDENTLVFMSTVNSTFTVAGASYASLEHGYYDANDNWVKQGDVTLNATFSISAGQCVRAVMN